MSEMERREFLMHAAGALAVMSLVPSLARAAPIRRGEPLPIGVIGLGRQGRAILGELGKIDAVQVAAACDTDAGRLESGLKRVGKGDAQGFADYRELLTKAKGLKAV